MHHLWVMKGTDVWFVNIWLIKFSRLCFFPVFNLLLVKMENFWCSINSFFPEDSLIQIWMRSHCHWVLRSHQMPVVNKNNCCSNKNHWSLRYLWKNSKPKTTHTQLITQGETTWNLSIISMNMPSKRTPLIYHRNLSSSITFKTFQTRRIQLSTLWQSNIIIIVA